jgi:hypothetical protein
MLVLLLACNTPPGAPTVAITPTEPLTGDDLEVVIQGEAPDDQGDDVTYAYAWFRDGASSEYTGTSVPADATARGETWKVVVTPSDGKAGGTVGEAEVRIGDTPPVATLAIDPLSPTTIDTVLATATATDADDDEVTLTWAWTRDGVNAGLSNDTLPAETAVRGEAWTVTVTPADDSAEGEPAIVGFTVANAPPTLGSILLSPDGATVSDTLTATFTGAEDADDDAVSVEVTWTVDGVDVFTETVDADGTSSLAGAFLRGQEVVVTGVPNDGYDDGESVVSQTLTIADAAPTATGARVSPDPLYADSVVTCVGEGWSDPDGDAEGWQTSWTVNGGVASTEATLPKGLYAKGDSVACTLVPDDGELVGTGVGSATVIVSNSVPTCTTSSVTIGPDPATLGDALSVTVDGYVGCADADGDALVEVYDWRVDGTGTFTSASVAAGSVARGATVTLVTSWSDGTESGGDATSNTLTIRNRAPIVSDVSISPPSPDTDDVVSALVTAGDEDGDSVSVTYAWTVNGVAAGTGATLDGATFSRGQTIGLTVTPSDGWDAGATASASAVVANSTPGAPAVGITPASPDTDDTLVCTVGAAATDLDGDALTYSFVWTVGGVAYSAATTTTLPGDTIPASATVNGQEWACSVTASDGTDSGSAGTASATVGCDQDADGYDDVACGGTDCDDSSSSVSPAATEVCDAADLDEDCDGLADDADPSLSATTYYPDVDGDAYGDSAGGVAACTRPSGWLTNGDDCDDTRSTVKPGATEICDAADLDEDCDGLADDADPSVSGQRAWYADTDGDTYGDEAGTAVTQCDQPSGYRASHSDCDDADAAINDAATEVCLDGIDQDCDGADVCDIYTSSAARKITGEAASDYASSGLANAGDVDSDGYDDILVTAYGHGGSAGVAYVVLGGSFTDIGLGSAYRTLTGSAGDSAGYSNAIAGVGDMTGDGIPDLVVGAEYSDLRGSNSGVAYFVAGGSTGTATLASAGTQIYGGTAYDHLGGSVAAAGDVSGDGQPDMLVTTGASASRAYLFATAPTASVSASSATATFTGGYVAKGAGDTDGDGYDDVMVGNPVASTSVGAAYLYLGPVSGSLSAAAADATISGSSASYLGEAICKAGDADGDGYSDVGIVADWYSTGYVYLVTGPMSSGTASSVAEATISGGYGAGATGCDFSGDADGDGTADLLFSEPHGNYDGAYLFLSPMTGSVYRDYAVYMSGTYPHYLGYPAAFIGDQDGDGDDEWVLSESDNDDAGIDAGAAWVFGAF